MDILDGLKIREIVYTVCRILLGIIFIYASWDKILDPGTFAKFIANYQIVSLSMGKLAAHFLPWLELVCGICLIINRWSRGSAMVVAMLLVVFMVALGYNIYRGYDISCGCFSLDEKAPTNMWISMILDAVLLAVAIGIILHPQSKTQTAVTK